MRYGLGIDFGGVICEKADAGAVAGYHVRTAELCSIHDQRFSIDGPPECRCFADQYSFCGGHLVILWDKEHILPRPKLLAHSAHELIKKRLECW